MHALTDVKRCRRVIAAFPSIHVFARPLQPFCDSKFMALQEGWTGRPSYKAYQRFTEDILRELRSRGEHVDNARSTDLIMCP